MYDYNRLRSWYLASLRKRIIKQAESGRLTPSALIAADTKAVEKLILESIKPEDGRSAAVAKIHSLSSVASTLWVRLSLIAAPILLQMPLVVFVLQNNISLASRQMLVGGLLTVALTTSIVIAILLRISIVEPLRTLRAAMNQNVHLEPKSNAGNIGEVKDDFIFLGCAFYALSDLLSKAIERENAIADYALDFICAIDKKGKLMAASPSCVEFCGWAIHELLGHQLTEFLIADDIEKTSRLLAIMPKSQETVPFENRFKRKDGKIMDILWLVEWSATEEMLFCIGRDISNQKRLERVRKEFVQMVGHDLRTPLTSLKCTMELLFSSACGELSEKGQVLVKNANENITRLLNLINDLLDLEKMELGKLPMKKQATSLDAILKASYDAVASYIRQRGLVIEIGESDAMVVGDKERLVQVMVNLLANAIKFSPAEGKICLKAYQERQDMVVEVSDQGPGIACEYHEVIFDRFQQIEDGKNAEGSGLGLSICKAIVEAHDGSIGVKSQLGQGSTFWFKVPLVQGQ